MIGKHYMLYLLSLSLLLSLGRPMGASGEILPIGENNSQAAEQYTSTSTAAPLTARAVFPTNDILWDQPVSIVNLNSYATQDFETANDNMDIFHGDDFTNTEPWQIGKIFIPGDTFNNGCDLNLAESLELSIYQDDNNIPGGQPDGGLGNPGNDPIWHISLPPDAPGVILSTGINGYASNVTVVLSKPLDLDPGHYWLVFYPKMSYTQANCQYGRHVADTGNGTPAQVINPGGGLYLPATWTSIQDANTWNLSQQDLAFTLARPSFPWILFIPAFVAGHD